MRLDKSRVNVFHPGMVTYYAYSNKFARDTNLCGSKRGQKISENHFEMIFGFIHFLNELIDVTYGQDREGNEKKITALDTEKILDVEKTYAPKDYLTEKKIPINQRAMSMPDNDIPLSIDAYKEHILVDIDNVTLYQCSEIFTITRNEAVYCQSASWPSGMLPQDAKRLRRHLDEMVQRLHLHVNLPLLDMPISHPGHESTKKGRHGDDGGQSE